MEEIILFVYIIKSLRPSSLHFLLLLIGWDAPRVGGNCSLSVSICIMSLQRLHGAFEKTVLPDACPKFYRKRNYEAGKQKSAQNA